MSTTDTRSYRASLILDTRGLETSADDLLSEFAGFASELGAEIIEKTNHGVQPFVRVTDRNFPEGTYVQIDLKAAPSFPADMKEKVRLDRRVNRIIVQSL
ncbi:MAG: 30S ribosomal protein S6 [Opitutales bacterium]|nr:30S ribosomal protein S6 [Opitutales bacterium]NRA26514.1 30S ribosomal protein S6 [Opitutales bacterium]